MLLRFCLLLHTLEKLSGMQFKEFCNIIFLTFLSGGKKKVPKPFPGPRLGGEIPQRWEKAKQEGPQASETADAPCHCGWLEMETRAVGGDLGLQLEPLPLGQVALLHTD